MMSDKVAIYVRLSREDEDKTCVQDASKSIENQIFTLKTFAQEQGFLIHEIYMDDGYSGASFERPALKKMLTDMERKKFSVVLLKDLSRLGRSLRKVGEYIEDIFPAHGIRVISLNDKYDSQSYKEDSSILFRGFLDEYYRKEFLKKCKQARIYYAHTKHLNYYPKYGYRYDGNGTEIIDSYSASIVRRIYEYITNDGLSCGKIADKLNADGVLTRSAYATTVLGLKALHKSSAKKWNAEKVWSIATDYEYCGHSINWSRLKANERIILKDTHCKIISEELYWQAQAVIKRRSRVANKLQHLGKYMIDIQTKKNLLFSKKQQIYYLRKDNKIVYSIRRTDIERLLTLELAQEIENRIKRYCEETERANNKEIERLRNEYAYLIEQLLQEKIEPTCFENRTAPILEKIKDLENGRGKSELKKKLVSVKKIVTKWKNGETVSLSILKTFLKRVEILKDEKNDFCIMIKYG